MSTPAPPAPQFAYPLPIVPSPAVLAYLARRRSASALALTAPGPDAAQLNDLLRLAARVPDHGKLTPWRFVILGGEAKTAFVVGLEAIAAASSDPVKLTAKLAKVKAPPLGVAVISSPVEGDIPAWEQLLSAGAVCTNLLHAATAMGFGANWITDWYAYDPDATALLGLADGEKVAGFVFIGTAAEPPAERVRPDVAALTTMWSPDQPRPR
ncbi:MAG: nitroreductase [Caulobacter sp.]|nr:nitroreductase [Caulobacter sp.]